MDRSKHADYVRQYQEKWFPLFEAYAQVLERILREAVKRLAPLSVVQSRPKSISSFAEKIIRKGYVAPFAQTTDLCAVRIITVTERQADAVSAFIKAHFDVDYPNSMDVGQRLRASEFGYRSLHYVVQLRPGTCLGIPIPPEILPHPDIPFKAEIQVRTLLQHGWAEVLHDRIYKNRVKPPRPLQRDAARLAALLEEGDTLITRLTRDLDAYVVDAGAHMRKQDIHREITNLELILSNEEDREAQERLALRLCQLLRVDRQWLSIHTVLEPLAQETRNAALLREYGHALCEECRGEIRRPQYPRGQQALLRSLELDPDCADTHAALARSYRRQVRETGKAHLHFCTAYHLAPENPYHLAAYMEYELLRAPSDALIPLVTPLVRDAMHACERHITAGIEVPRSCLTLGKFCLFLGESDACFRAYLAGILAILDKKDAAGVELLETELDSVARLEGAKGGQPGDKQPGGILLEGVRRLLQIGLHCLNGDRASLQELQKARRLKYDPRKNILLIAGTCAQAEGEGWNDFQQIFRDAVADFEGVIIGGGTAAGVSGLLAELAALPHRRFLTTGYLPRNQAATSGYDALEVSETLDFTPIDAIQAWVDLIASGIPPARITLLGYGGGDISGVEYRIGLAFGASVGLMANSGGTVDALLLDPFWSVAARPLGLVHDPMTLRAFLIPGSGSIPEGRREALARSIHKVYCKADTSNLNKRILKENGLPWDLLPSTYRNANFAQADYIGEIMKTEGFTLEAVEGTADNSAVAFDPEQIERMAEKEHGRWNVERLREGWRPGIRDDENKRHDCLVPWKCLPEDIKQYDRDSVISWPTLLAETGIRIVK